MAPKVCVLLCTYNGEKYLERQLESVFGQKNVELQILVHDDGSTDGTADILSKYNIPVIGSEHLGAAHGFFYLMEHAPEADYYAFCDQDDVWDRDKLSAAINSIDRELEKFGGYRASKVGIKSEENLQKPMLYACSTRLVDQDENFLQTHIADPSRTLTSRLFYSSISGNTMVFNKQLKNIAVMHHPKDMVMHDSWMVKLCVAIGGGLVVDREPHMDYRMHGNNVVGMELNLKQKIEKFRRVVRSKGEGQELIDICSLYGAMIRSEYRRMADAVQKTRTDASARKTFVKDFNVDFKNKGFNMAFGLKVKKGNL